MRIIVFGGSGFLGEKLLNYLSRENETLGTYSSGGKYARPSNLVKLDIRSMETVESVFNKFKPDLAINCSAICNLESCEENKKQAYEVHVNGTANIGECCKKYGTKMIYFSTDYIFDGKSGPYCESSLPNPLNYYGITKLEGEKILAGIVPRYLIIRPTILYGYNGENDKPSFVTQTVKKLVNGNTVVADNKRIKYPILIDDIGKLVDHFNKIDAEGIYNLATKEGFTRYTWAKLIAKVFSLDSSNIFPENADSYNKNRPVDVNLSIFKLEKTGFSPSGLERGLKIMKKQMEGGN